MSELYLIINMMSTISEENYLKAIFKLSQNANKEITTKEIADYLNTKPSSVTDMMQKLAEKKLVHYTRYKGVNLTVDGKKLGTQIIRKHRLWELFLFQELGFKWDEIHEIAEELEHIKSNALTERLDAYLKYPQFDPHGDPIPDQEGNFPKNNSFPLSHFKRNTIGIVSGVNNHNAVFLSYLDNLGIQLGTEIEVLECHEFDHSFEIKINENRNVHMSFQAVQNIQLIPK
jgi:DtxR family transcriptional regulator, Mn-dependent transcriptional regulator